MSIFKFSTLLGLLGGGDAVPEDESALFREALYLALTRAAAADAKIEKVELETIRQVMADKAGANLSAEEIRDRTVEHVYETATFDRLMVAARKRLGLPDRVAIVLALGDLIRIDNDISPLETDYFNHVVQLLDLKPADIQQLYHSPRM